MKNMIKWLRYEKVENPEQVETTIIVVGLVATAVLYTISCVWGLPV